MSVCINCIIRAYICMHTESACIRAARSLLSLFSQRDLFHMPAVHSHSLRHLHCGTCQIKLVILVCDLPASSLPLVGVTGLHWKSKRLGAVYVRELAISFIIKRLIFLK